MKMMLLIIVMVMIELSVSNIDETKDPIDCDLGAVGVDEDVSCLITVREADTSPEGEGSYVNVRNSLHLIDSSNTNSYCKDPRIDINFIDNDLSASNEYFDVFEGLTIDDPTKLIQRCSGSDGACDRKICVTDKALANNYGVGSSVDITVYVTKHVDGVHWNSGPDVCEGGYQIDSEITFKCTRGECPKYFKYDAVTSKCERDCGSFAIDEYLECSTTYTEDISSLETDVGTLKNTVNVDHENRITQNKASIDAAIENLQEQINTNYEDIDTLKTETIPDLETELKGGIDANALEIGKLKTETIADLRSILDDHYNRITENEESIEALKPWSGASAVSMNAMDGIENNNVSILSENKDLLLLISALINIFVLSTSLVLCIKLNKSNKYGKVASYASDA